MIAESLPGLPPYGNPAKSFPEPNAFREGFVVGFTPTGGERWVGNFERGPKTPYGIHENFGERAVLVVAGGDVFVVDAKAQQAALEFAWATDVRFEADLDIFLITDDCHVTALGRSGIVWRSRRISWDGIAGLERRGMSLHGLAFDICDQPPAPFTIDLQTGSVGGGSYLIPDGVEPQTAPTSLKAYEAEREIWFRRTWLWGSTAVHWKGGLAILAGIAVGGAGFWLGEYLDNAWVSGAALVAAIVGTCITAERHMDDRRH